MRMDNSEMPGFSLCKELAVASAPLMDSEPCHKTCYFNLILYCFYDIYLGLSTKIKVLNLPEVKLSCKELNISQSKIDCQTNVNPQK